MSPLPRFLALALFVVLSALLALLIAPAWRSVAPYNGAPAGTTSSSVNTAGLPRSQRMLAFSQRAVLGLAFVGTGLAAALAISLGYRRFRTRDTPHPFSAVRSEVGALARLAESSVAQGVELSRERDVRRRAEEDVLLKQQLLAHSLDEKVRLGRDLHDGMIQSLYAAGLTLESVRAILKSDPDEADRRLERTRTSLNDAIRDVRAYITGLTPHELHRAGFTHAMETMIAELTAGRTLEFEVKIDEEAAGLLNDGQTIEVLQIAREAVSNALRHGQASRVTVRVHQSDREVCLLVQDNGIGFDAANRREGGHGMENMRARAAQLGATLRVASQPGEGSRIIATLPIVPSSRP